MTAWTDNKLYTPRMGRFNSTRIKWAYHTLTQKKDVAFVQIVQDNFEDFVKIEISAAKLAS